jgi:predicted AAA+ superfamily ATPase
MNFEEFLLNYNRPAIYTAFEDGFNNMETSTMLHLKLWNILQEFYVVGGMPRIVSHYFSLLDQPAKAFKEVRAMQRDLISTYQSDFNKHAGKINSLHINSVFENIPLQLAGYMNESVHRYRFKDVIPGKKGFTELDRPISWLEKAGLIIKIDICERSQIPLKSFCKPNIFKLFIFDIGLLGQMLELSPKTIISQNYGLIKGFLAENFVATEFIAAGENNLYSWTERNSEIEFIKDHAGEIVPIEVKSSQRVKAKSLRQYRLKYNPPTAIIISGKALKQVNPQVQNYPLYYSGKLMAKLQQK